MDGVLLGPRTAEAAAQFFSRPNWCTASILRCAIPHEHDGRQTVPDDDHYHGAFGRELAMDAGIGSGNMLECYDDAGTIKLRTTGVIVTLKHAATAAIASGRIVQAKLVDGRWLVDVDYC